MKKVNDIRQQESGLNDFRKFDQPQHYSMSQENSQVFITFNCNKETRSMPITNEYFEKLS